MTYYTPPTPSRFSHYIRRFTGQFLVYAALIIVCLVTMAPFFIMVVDSLMNTDEIFAVVPHLWPQRLVFENYSNVFNNQIFSPPFLTYLVNTVFIATVQTIGVLFFTSLMGFVFAKRRFPGRDKLFMLMLSTMVLPGGVIIMIPLYLIMNRLHWVNTFLPLIVPWLTPAYLTFLMRQYIIHGVPDELVDSAQIDGCGFWGTYWHMILPLSIPALVVVGLQNFVNSYNDYFLSLLFLQKAPIQTLSIALQNLSGRTQLPVLYGPLFAGMVISIIPLILLFIIFQRRLTGGILAGALRG